jgi:hypothetical protein
MDKTRVSEDSLTVTEFKAGAPGGGQVYPVLDDGTYEAEYQKMKVFMDNTQWGLKKCSRLYFAITRGRYKGQTTTFKGQFFEDRVTKDWIVGSKSKLADAIRAISGGKSLTPENIGAKVFVVVKKGTSKKDGHEYSFVENIIPRPVDDGEGTIAQEAEAAHASTQAAAAVQPAAPAPANKDFAGRPMPAQAPQAAKPAPAPAARPVIPAPTEDTSDGLLADLTELSDFKD